MPEMTHTRNADESLTITSPNGVAVVSRTPDVEIATARAFTAHINGIFQDTYDTVEEAVSDCHEILAVKR